MSLKMTILEEKITARIRELENELDRFVKEANLRITATQAAIAELKNLLLTNEVSNDPGPENG